MMGSMPLYFPSKECLWHSIVISIGLAILQKESLNDKMLTMPQQSTDPWDPWRGMGACVVEALVPHKTLFATCSDGA